MPEDPRTARRWWAAGALAGAASITPLLVWSAGTPEPDRFFDLEVYTAAARALRDGEALYGFRTEIGLPFTYPPFAALLALPLAPLPGLLAGLAWALASIAALGFVVRRTSGPLRRALRNRAGVRAGSLLAGGLLGAALWTQPVRDTLRFGQVGVLLAALVVADLTTRHPRWPRGALIGLAAAIKLTPALFVVHLWLSGQRRAAAVATATAAGCTGLAVVLLPGPSVTYWTGAIFDTGRIGDDANGGNQALLGMAVRAGLDGVPLLLVLLVAGSLLAVVGLRRAASLARAGEAVPALVVVGCLSVLLTPIGWIHHLVWLVPAAAVLGGDLRSQRRTALAALLMLAAWARLPWQAEAALLDDLPGRPFWLLVQSGLGLAAAAVVLALPAAGRNATDPLRRVHTGGT